MFQALSCYPDPHRRTCIDELFLLGEHKLGVVETFLGQHAQGWPSDSLAKLPARPWADFPPTHATLFNPQCTAWPSTSASASAILHLFEVRCCSFFTVLVYRHYYAHYATYEEFQSKYSIFMQQYSTFCSKNESFYICDSHTPVVPFLSLLE